MCAKPIAAGRGFMTWSLAAFPPLVGGARWKLSIVSLVRVFWKWVSAPAWRCRSIGAIYKWLALTCRGRCWPRPMNVWPKISFPMCAVWLK